MIDLEYPPVQPLRATATAGAASRCRSRLALELRVVAEDMAGRVDRDELTREEELILADALEATVAAVLPEVVKALDDALTPRLEALPLHARLTLVRARGRREFGLG
jgi:hypothetical protein